MQVNYKIDVPVLVDSIQAGDLFEKRYAAWPFRFYVLEKSSSGDVQERFPITWQK